MLHILNAPHDVLSTKAKPVEKIDQTIKQLISDMSETLINAKDPEGVGLAAPQIGKSLQIFIIKPTPTYPIEIFINPIMHIPDGVELAKEALTKTGKKKKKGVTLEGCLSLKDIWGVVRRYPKVELAYQDETGARHEKLFTGFMATIIQHEYDHLQGILFPKHVLEQGNILYKSVVDENGETVFEELKI